MTSEAQTICQSIIDRFTPYKMWVVFVELEETCTPLLDGNLELKCSIEVQLMQDMKNGYPHHHPFADSVFRFLGSGKTYNEAFLNLNPKLEDHIEKCKFDFNKDKLWKSKVGSNVEVVNHLYKYDYIPIGSKGKIINHRPGFLCVDFENGGSNKPLTGIWLYIDLFDNYYYKGNTQEKVFSPYIKIVD